MSDEWTDITSIYYLVRDVVFKASTTAICGPYFFSLNPTIRKVFWDFDMHMPKLFKLLPRWMIPGSFRARDKVLFAIKKWHAFAKENCDLDDEEVQKSEWEPYFGSKLMRDRQREYGAIGHDADALASQDLAMI